MKTISLADLERQLIARKPKPGIVGADFLLVNDGARRTASKQRLLQTIPENAAAQGRKSRFKANGA
jgi:hypothetical protein